MSISGIFPIFPRLTSPRRTARCSPPRLLHAAQAAALSLLAALLFASPAFAHTILVRSEPAENSVLQHSPTQVRLVFSEEISEQFMQVRLMDLQGRLLATGSPRRGENEPAELLVDLPTLPDSVYTLDWKVLSEDDGHVVRGSLVFGVGAVSRPAPEKAGAALPSPWEAAGRGLSLAALAGLAGALAVAAWVLQPGAREARRRGNLLAAAELQRAGQRALGWGIFASGLAWFAGLALLAVQISSLAGGMPLSASLQGQWFERLVIGTRWGVLWLVRQALLLALVSILPRLHRQWGGAGAGSGASPLLLGAAGWLAGGVLVIQALGSHAAASAEEALLAVAADALHLLAASLWVGGLAVLLASLWPALRQGRAQAAAVLQAGVGPFSRLAALSVLVLLITGIYGLGRQVASLDALLTTFYGQALLVKIGLLLGIGAAGLLNSLLLHPAAARPLGRALRRPVGWTPLSLAHLPQLMAVEALLGSAALLAAALLTASPPAQGPQFSPAQPQELVTRTAGDLLVTFSAQPNLPGQNVFTVAAASTRKPALAPVSGVSLRFVPPGGEAPSVLDARPLERDVYRAGGENLDRPGAWQVTVVVHRPGLPDQAAVFSWVTPAAAGEAQPWISDRPLAPFTRAAAGLLALLLAAGGAAWASRRRIARPAGAPSRS